jgi:hypothetical protein
VGGVTPSASVSGAYNLTVTRCNLPQETAPVSMTFECGGSNVWTLTRNGSEVTGINNVQCAPFSSSGSLTGQVRADGAIEITTLQFRQSSSHTSVDTLSVKGTAAVDRFGYAGMFSGEFTSTPVFGGFAGPTSSCRGEGMPFQLLRRN